MNIERSMMKMCNQTMLSILYKVSNKIISYQSTKPPINKYYFVVTELLIFVGR